jgi:DNA polymerase elongation subunit (family B)
MDEKMKDPNRLKILLLDLELTFAIYYAYPSKREQYLSDKNIVHDQFCTCAAWKWHDEVSVYAVKITDDKKQFKKDFRNDKIVAIKLHALMEEADVIVAHNGDNFDIKHANTLFRKHNLGPIPKRKSIDTLKVARKYFAFPGNSLDSLSKRFGSIGKNQKPNWHKMTDGDAKEIDIAATYCKNDVRELEVIFNELKPYIESFPTLTKKGRPEQCDCCGSKRIQSRGKTFANNKLMERFKCMECCHNHYRSAK